MKKAIFALACLLAIGTSASAQAQDKTPVKKETKAKKCCKDKAKAEAKKTCDCKGKCVCNEEKHCGCRTKTQACSTDKNKEMKQTCKACAEGKACAHHGKAAADSTKKDCCKKK